MRRQLWSMIILAGVLTNCAMHFLVIAGDANPDIRGATQHVITTLNVVLCILGAVNVSRHDQPRIELLWMRGTGAERIGLAARLCQALPWMATSLLVLMFLVPNLMPALSLTVGLLALVSVFLQLYLERGLFSLWETVDETRPVESPKMM